MKYETLLTRYKNLGYPIKNLERDLEIASLIKWIYETYNYYVYNIYIDMNFDNGSHRKFKGGHRAAVGEPHSISFFCDKAFDNPYDALYDSVRDLYPHLKFMGDSIKVQK